MKPAMRFGTLTRFTALTTYATDIHKRTVRKTFLVPSPFRRCFVEIDNNFTHGSRSHYTNNSGTSLYVPFYTEYFIMKNIITDNPPIDKTIICKYRKNPMHEYML